MARKLTQEEFVTKVRERYGGKYGLSKAVYQGGKVKVTVGCKIHGDFEIRPNDLLMGTGCPKCGGTKKLTTEEFVRKSNIVHNNFFTYDHCEYKGSGEKVIITCPYHGDFEQKACNHLNGYNCPKCSKEGITHKITPNQKINASTKKITQEEFIRRATEMYGDVYDFSKSVYVKSCDKVVVTCRKHGDFEITPNHLFGGRGCPQCGGNKRMTTKDFIRKAHAVHGEKFKYDKTDYRSTHENVVITCPKHGDFEQAPSNHLSGQGCPICNQSKLESEIMEFLKSHGMVFEPQKAFEWMGRMRLDFYLPDYNTGIECQGVQHFDADAYYGDEKIFERDKTKRELCESHGVRLVYFSNLGIEYPYKVFENKEELLKEIIGDGNSDK